MPPSRRRNTSRIQTCGSGAGRATGSSTAPMIPCVEGRCGVMLFETAPGGETMAEDARVARGPHDKHAVHARIVDRLRQHAEDVTRMVAGLGEADLARRTVPDKWSVK